MKKNKTLIIVIVIAIIILLGAGGLIYYLSNKKNDSINIENIKIIYNNNILNDESKSDEEIANIQKYTKLYYKYNVIQTDNDFNIINASYLDKLTIVINQIYIDSYSNSLNLSYSNNDVKNTYEYNNETYYFQNKKIDKNTLNIYYKKAFNSDITNIEVITLSFNYKCGNVIYVYDSSLNGYLEYSKLTDTCTVSNTSSYLNYEINDNVLNIYEVNNNRYYKYKFNISNDNYILVGKYVVDGSTFNKDNFINNVKNAVLIARNKYVESHNNNEIKNNAKECYSIKDINNDLNGSISVEYKDNSLYLTVWASNGTYLLDGENVTESNSVASNNCNNSK